MNRRTHMVVGAAASLAVLRPVGIAACLANVAGGMLGGWICDIDLNTNKRLKAYGFALRLLLPLALLAMADERFGLSLASGALEGHLFDWATRERVVGVAAFLLVSLEGATNRWLRGHRSFMHSLLAVALFTLAVRMACAPLAPSFAVGMLLHIALDLTNKQGVQVLFPLSWRPCLHWFDSGGKADEAIYRVSAVALCVLVVLMVAINRS